MGEYLLRNQEGNPNHFTTTIDKWIDGVQVLLPRTLLWVPEEVRRGVDFGPTITTSSSRDTVDHVNCRRGQP